MADAYMLVYRRISADNIMKVEDSEVPDALVQEIKVENAELQTAKEEHTERAKFHVFLAHFGKPELQLMIPVAIPQAAPVAQVLEKALKESGFGFESRGVTSLGQLRIRDYSVAKNRVLGELDAKELEKEAKDFPAQKDLYIDERLDETQAWPAYEPVALRLKLAIMAEAVPSKAQYLPILVDEEGNLNTLRQAVAAKMELPPSEVRLAMKVDEGNVSVVVELLPEQGPAKLADLRIGSGTVIFAENKSHQRLITALQSLVHTVTVRFNRPGSEELTEEVDVDDRDTMGKLKQLIGSALSLSLDAFKLRKDEGGPELKALGKSLDFHNIRDLKSVYVELGKPLREGEFICKVFLHDPPELRTSPREETKDAVTAIMGVEGEMVEFVEADFIMLGHVVVEEQWDLIELTRAIATLEKAPKDPELIRVREGFNGILTRPYLPGISLKQNCPGLSDFTPLYIQPLERPEVLHKDSRIVYLRQWYPQSFTLGVRVEIALNGTITVAELKRLLVMYLEQESTEDQIRLVIPTPQQQNDVAAISGLAWHEPGLGSTLVLTQPPLRLRHGDTILFKDMNTKNEKNQKCATPLTVAERAKLSNLRHSTAGIAWDGTRRAGFARGEVGLKIFTAQEQEERAAARKAEEERLASEKAKNDAIPLPSSGIAR